MIDMITCPACGMENSYLEATNEQHTGYICTYCSHNWSDQDTEINEDDPDTPGEDWKDTQ